MHILDSVQSDSSPSASGGAGHDAPPFAPLTRRALIQRLGWSSLGLFVSPCFADSSPEEALAEPAADGQHLRTRDRVPDPRDIGFTVHYPGRDPIRLVGHYWFNAATVASGQRCPAIVEFNPYRRRDGMLLSDSWMYPWFAANDYLCFRVDLQGSGDSEGVLTDEYSDEELAYCVQVIEQIARHPVCDGQVGMMGKSWSAINSLMVAARADRPSALKAVMVCCGTDDRYNDDVHYQGGAMLADNAGWASSMWGWLAAPPDPMTVGGRWEAIWRERIKQASFWFVPWAEHQTRDDYWRATSVRDHYDQVKIPVFFIGGWQDVVYKNPIERAVAALSTTDTPVAGLIGPWGHKYPFDGYPGPRIDWLRSTVTHWWDRWLRGRESSPETRWQTLTVWLGESREPSPSACGDEPGRWVAEDAQWRTRARERTWYLGADRGLIDEPPVNRLALSVPTPAPGVTVMLENSSWGECGNDDLPGDQAPADRQALTFDSVPLTADLDVFGYPVANLVLRSDQPLAVIAVRLCEVSPSTGASRLVSYSYRNLCHGDDDRSNPRRLDHGVPFQIRVPLGLTGHTFKAGWRIRLAISPACFPTLWSSPRTAHLTLDTGPLVGFAASALMLPERLPRLADASLRTRLPIRSQGTYVDDRDYLPILAEARPARNERTASAVIIDGKPGVLIHKVFDSGRYQYGGPLAGLWVDLVGEENYQIAEDDPATMTCVTRVSQRFERPDPDWTARAETITRIWSEPTSNGDFAFRFEATVQTYVGRGAEERPFESKTLTGTIPRRWV